MRQTVVGVFDRYAAAQQAARALAARGIEHDCIHLAPDGEAAGEPDGHGEDRGVVGHLRGFWHSLFGTGDEPDGEPPGRGAARVQVEVDDEPRVNLAREALLEAGAVDIEEHMDRRHSAAATAAAGAPRVEAAPPPRRDPPPALAGSALPVLQDEVPQPGAPAAAADPEHDFRVHFEATYGDAGARYEDYLPAYRFGRGLGHDRRYLGWGWEAVEPQARRMWTRVNPSHPWEHFRRAVRHAWERVRG